MEGDGRATMGTPAGEIPPARYAEGQRAYYRRYMVNREFIREEAEFPSAQCFAHGLDFIQTNRFADNWFLQIETFDPHEPFYAPAEFRERFRTGWNGPIRDWPRYGRVDEVAEECEELRANYYALAASAMRCSGGCSIRSTQTACGTTPP